jgi:hypothetical protein
MVEFERKPPEIYGRPFDAEYNVVTDIIYNATSPGTNVMAVEVHNADHVNRDLKYVGDGHGTCSRAQERRQLTLHIAPIRTQTRTTGRQYTRSAHTGAYSAHTQHGAWR